MVGLACTLFGVSGVLIFFFKQKTAYEVRISDWSSDVCSSDLTGHCLMHLLYHRLILMRAGDGENARVRPADAIPFDAKAAGDDDLEIGRASCRERVCQYV